MSAHEQAKKYERQSFATASRAIADSRTQLLAAKGRIGVAPEIDFNVGFQFRVKFRIGGSVEGEVEGKKKEAAPATTTTTTEASVQEPAQTETETTTVRSDDTPIVSPLQTLSTPVAA